MADVTDASHRFDPKTEIHAHTKIRTPLLAFGLGGVGVGAAIAAPMNATGYTLSDGGSTLVVQTRLDLPGTAREVPLSFDGAATTLDSLALRPNGRRLYGYSEAADAVYEIDVDTGAAMALASLPQPSDAAISGFDILSLDEGMNEAFALLTVDGMQDIYSIDLDTGMASLLGDAPTQFGELDGFAVAPIPVPAALGMLGLGLGGLSGLAGLRRIRRRAA